MKPARRAPIDLAEDSSSVSTSLVFPEVEHPAAGIPVLVRLQLLRDLQCAVAEVKNHELTGALDTQAYVAAGFRAQRQRLNLVSLGFPEAEITAAWVAGVADAG